MELLSESQFYHIHSIENGMLVNVHNIDSFGRPALKLKKVEEVYMTSKPIKFMPPVFQKKNRSRRRLVSSKDVKTESEIDEGVYSDQKSTEESSNSADKLTLKQISNACRPEKRTCRELNDLTVESVESDEATIDNEVPLIVWKSILTKKLKNKKYTVKPCNDVSKESAFVSSIEPQCSLNKAFFESAREDDVTTEAIEPDCQNMSCATFIDTAVSSSREFLESAIVYDIKTEASDPDYQSIPCNICSETGASPDDAKQAPIDEGANLLESKESNSVCSLGEKYLNQTVDDINGNFGCSVLIETHDIGDIQVDSLDSSLHHEIISHTGGENVVLEGDMASYETEHGHGNTLILVNANVRDESPSYKSEEIQNSLDDVELRQDEHLAYDIDRTGNVSALHLSTDRLLSKRKTMSPTSQEELCRALNISKMDDTGKNSTSEGGEVRGILKIPSRVGCTCSQSAIAFSQRQMQDITSLATKLTEEVNYMKGILDRRDGSQLSDEVVVAIERANRAEDTSSRWLSMMSRDCNRFCKIMRNKNEKESGGSKERKKIVFADEVGKMLCHVKVLEDDASCDLLG